MMVFGGTFEEEFYFNKTKEKIEMEEKDWIDISNYKPEEVNDENEFKPIAGAYECRIDRLEHVTGKNKVTEEPFDFYSLSAQIEEVVEGDKGVGRYLKKTYQSNDEGIKKLLNDMFSSGIELDRSSKDAFDASLGSAKDKMIKIRAGVWTPEKDNKGNEIPEADRKARQTVKIVKAFKLGKKGKDNESPKSSEVPF